MFTDGHSRIFDLLHKNAVTLLFSLSLFCYPAFLYGQDTVILPALRQVLVYGNNTRIDTCHEVPRLKFREGVIIEMMPVKGRERLSIFPELGNQVTPGWWPTATPAAARG